MADWRKAASAFDALAEKEHDDRPRSGWLRLGGLAAGALALVACGSSDDPVALGRDAVESDGDRPPPRRRRTPAP